MRPIREWPLTNWLIIIGVFVILLLGAVILYVVLTPQVFVPQPPPEVITPGGELPTPEEGVPTFPPSEVEQVPLEEIQAVDTFSPFDETARGSLTSVANLTDFPTEFVSLDPSGNGLNYYDPSTSQFYRIDASGNITSLNSPVFAEVQNVVYAPNASDAILEFPDGSNILYNLDSQEQITLPAHWEDFDFSPSSSQIAFKSIALDPDQRWLAVSDTSGGSLKAIEPLGDNQDILDVDWSPNNQVIGTYSEPTGLSNSELFFVGFNKENFALSKLEGINFEGSWSPTGQKLLYSVADDSTGFRPNLWLTDGSGTTMGTNRKSVPLNTWSYKCGFMGTTKAICGVPESLPQGAGLIPSVADDIRDYLVSVDLLTGKTSILAIPDQQLNVESLQVSEDGTSIFIHDRFTNRIKKINL